MRTWTGRVSANDLRPKVLPQERRPHCSGTLISHPSTGLTRQATPRLARPTSALFLASLRSGLGSDATHKPGWRSHAEYPFPWMTSLAPTHGRADRSRGRVTQGPAGGPDLDSTDERVEGVVSAGVGASDTRERQRTCVLALLSRSPSQLIHCFVASERQPLSNVATMAGNGSSLRPVSLVGE